MEHDPNRRMLITALAGLTLANVSFASAATGTANVQGKSRVLVAYFSRSGNTRVIAGVIHRSLNTDLFEIELATPYPEDYFQAVEQAKNERERGVRANYSSPSLLTAATVKETAMTFLPAWPQLPAVKKRWLLNATRSGKSQKRSPVG